jgi:hypothetical protein
MIREILWQSDKDLFCQKRESYVILHPVPSEYNNGYDGVDDYHQTNKAQPVFITARFRSGSTFLWQIFRNVENCTSYYEPFNPARWFLPAQKKFKIDPSHLGVDNYHAEYAGLEHLDQWFRGEWAEKYLYMHSSHIDLDMFRYISALIDNAKGLPVLQFNRVDFRLQWLKANFPEAKIIHLYRNPREQWMSILASENIRVPLEYDCSKNQALPLFYTYQWVNDLRHVFSFLEPQIAPHPYALHYLLWRLSFTFGKSFSDCSVSYENLTTNFKVSITELMACCNITSFDLAKLESLNKANPRIRWKDYAPEEWFNRIEQQCDRILRIYFEQKVTNEMVIIPHA